MLTSTRSRLERFAEAYEQAADRWSANSAPHWLLIATAIGEGECYINVLCVDCGHEYLVAAIVEDGRLMVQHWVPMGKVHETEDALASYAVREAS